MKSLSEFYPQLAKLAEFRASISDEYGEAASAVLSYIETGDESFFGEDQEIGSYEVDSFVDDLVNNEAVEVESMEGEAPDDDVFPIMTMRYGPVFFVSAPEFDRIGFFASADEAFENGVGDFEPYVSGLSESDENKPDSAPFEVFVNPHFDSAPLARDPMEELRLERHRNRKEKGALSDDGGKIVEFKVSLATARRLSESR